MPAPTDCQPHRDELGLTSHLTARNPRQTKSCSRPHKSAARAKHVNGASVQEGLNLISPSLLETQAPEIHLAASLPTTSSTWNRPEQPLAGSRSESLCLKRSHPWRNDLSVTNTSLEHGVLWGLLTSSWEHRTSKKVPLRTGTRLCRNSQAASSAPFHSSSLGYVETCSSFHWSNP